MKTNYLQIRTSGHRTLFSGVMILIVTGAILYVAGKPLLSFFSRAGVVSGSLISRGADSTDLFLGSVGAYFSSRNALLEENRLLSDELAIARLAVIREEAFKNENDALRALFLREPKGERGILAEVLLRPPSSPYDTLVLDAGVEAGVSVGNRVVAEGFLVGEITRADRASSVATLWSQSGRSFDAAIPEKFSGRAEGYGSGNFYIRVPRDTKIIEGDIVTAPALGDFLLGRVKSVVRDEKNPFVDVYAESPLSLRTVRFVEIVKDRKMY